jgi:hypothetical protein
MSVNPAVLAPLHAQFGELTGPGDHAGVGGVREPLLV